MALRFERVEVFEQAVLRNGTFLNCHHPPPGLASGEPDDRLRRVTQYAAAYRFNH
jgi:hypothetical protein